LSRRPPVGISPRHRPRQSRAEPRHPRAAIGLCHQPAAALAARAVCRSAFPQQPPWQARAVGPGRRV